MNKKTQVVANTLFAIMCAAFISTKSFAEPLNLTHHKAEVKKYHDSGEYQNELTSIITQATNYIKQRAKFNQQHNNAKKLAIVLDIDETSLSNYNRMLARDFSSDSKQIHQAFLAADAPAIEPMLHLYKDALAQQVAVFFVTGRSEKFQDVTELNLKRAGYYAWTGLYFRPNVYPESSIVPFKSQIRAEITQQGYTVIASIGDQASDLNGGYAERTYKLPNPYYYIP